MKKLVICFCILFSITSCTNRGEVIRDNRENLKTLYLDEISNLPSTIDGENNDSIETEPQKNIPEYLNYTANGSDLQFENILSENEVYTRYQIGYKSDKYSISGIMNIPKGEGDFPLIILNHGYIDPEIYTLGRGLKREQDYLARQGFTVLHTDYRNHALSDTDKSLNSTGSILRSKKYGTDAINAILAVKEGKNNNIKELQFVNPDKVGMLGHSMGGGVSMYALVAAPELINGVVLYAPVHSNEWYNYKRWREDGLSIEEKSQLTQIYGDLENTDVFLNISPQRYFNNIQAPIQIYWGTEDQSCPIEWSDDIVKALQESGNSPELIIYQGEKHEFIPKFQEFMESSTTFFHKNL